MSRLAQWAVCQFEPTLGDIEQNYQQIKAHLDQMCDSVELAVFPELCTTGYVPEIAAELAQPIPGPITDPLVEIAKIHDLQLVVGVPERSGETVYNSSVLLGRNGIETVYRKQYLWGDESEFFSRGNTAVCAETDFGRLGLLVCYDLNFPEVSLAYARKECDALIVISAWRRSFHDDWLLLARTRAFDGTCYLLGSNQAGSQRGRVHAGGSVVTAPDGTIIEQLPNKSGAATVSLDSESLKQARTRNPVFKHRRNVSNN